MITMQLTGQRALTRVLDQYEARVRRAVIQVIATFALAVEAGAKRNAPVDTGNLRATIRTDLERLATDLVALVVAGASYAAFVEFGTSRMSAKPFLFPALEAERRAFLRAIRRAVRSAGR